MSFLVCLTSNSIMCYCSHFVGKQINLLCASTQNKLLQTGTLSKGMTSLPGEFDCRFSQMLGWVWLILHINDEQVAYWHLVQGNIICLTT